MDYFSSRTSTDKVHTVQMLSKDDFGEFFSDLASKIFELLASLASALKILIPPLYTISQVAYQKTLLLDINTILNHYNSQGPYIYFVLSGLHLSLRV
jgi:hypothetical protein